MSLQGYQYVVLRCVPRVEREEFVNVGVVLYSQGADFLEAGYAVDEARLRALAPGVEAAEVRDALEAVCRVCRGETGGGLPDLGSPGRRFGWLSAPRSTVVQPGPVHGGLTADPRAELAGLVERMVG
ncbi:MAG TPA: DUF3037 domain-containing protein [Pedococcus sp.]|jgi:hypothetical protein|uniref:DUF3037 domain-containing protein n=1 Tax=Pedococcus sp. TaxID=2860345 RepID=UPI002F9389AF